MSALRGLLLLAALAATACGKKKGKDLELKGSYVKCRACEVVSEILVGGLVEGDKRMDPNRKVALGHRLDPNGKHLSREFDFKRSETRITEHLEGVCGKMSRYAFLSVAMPAKKKGGPRRKVSYLVEKTLIPDSAALQHNLKSKVKESVSTRTAGAIPRPPHPLYKTSLVPFERSKRTCIYSNMYDHLQPRP